MKAFTAGLGVETNTFSALYVGMENFRDAYLYRPGDHPQALTEVSAPLFVLRRKRREEGLALVEGTYAFALPGGRVGAQTYAALRDEILDQLAAALPLDYVALSMHGAMASTDDDDCEGDFLARARDIVGPDVPIGVEIDPHAHLSERMVAGANVIVAMQEYPHTDFLARGEHLVGLLERLAQREITPVSAVFDCRTIGRFHTYREPMRGLVDALHRRVGEQPGLLSLSIIHGFPWGDVQDMGAKVLAIADADADLARDVAEEFGEALRRIRAQAFTPPKPIAAALDEALSLSPPVVLADVSDNPGGGAAGDATVLLKALLACGVDACLGPLWDPQAVRIAQAAGAGACIRLRLGGKTGAAGGEPLDLDGEVTAICESAWQTWAGGPAPLGRACAFRTGKVQIVLTSLRDQAYSPDLFTNLGIDPATCRIVAVKSAQHFVDGFNRLSDRIVLASGGGPLETDFRRIDYRHVQRPIWPLDAEA